VEKVVEEKESYKNERNEMNLPHEKGRTANTRKN
jgi:hypothetical protein